MTIPEIWQRFQLPGTPENPTAIPTIASATSIDLSADPSPIVKISGVTDIANIKPPYEGFIGRVSFIFPDATPPDFVSGGSPATGYYAVNLTVSPARYQVVDLFFDGAAWFPAMV